MTAEMWRRDLSGVAAGVEEPRQQDGMTGRQWVGVREKENPRLESHPRYFATAMDYQWHKMEMQGALFVDVLYKF
jgi:hypothetical protein